jgi:hypothetical protein
MGRLTISAVILFFSLAVNVSMGENREYIKKVPAFSKIEINGRVSAVLEKANENSLSIFVKRGSIDDLDIYVSGDTLYLKKTGSLYQTRNITVKISVSGAVKELSVLSGALVKSYRNIFDAESAVRAASGSSLELYADLASVFIQCGRNSSINLRGIAGKMEARAEHGGVIDASLFEVSAANVYSYTGSSIKVNVRDFLEAASGLESIIYYKKEPAEKHFSTALAGKYIEY